MRRAVDPDPPELVPGPPGPEGVPILAGAHTQSRARGSVIVYRPQGTRDWIMIATQSGEGYVRTGRSRQVLRRGDVLLIQPDTPQEYGYADDRTEWFSTWAHFHPNPRLLPRLVWPSIGKGLMLVSLGEQIAEFEPELRRMVEVSSQATRLRLELGMNSLERIILMCNEYNPLQETMVSDARIRKAIEIIGEDLSQPLNIDRLSRGVGLSRSRFSVLFAQETRMTPQNYVEYVRLARAAQMLVMSTWAVGTIAEAVGFSNPYYFSTRFSLRYKMSPSAWRATNTRPPS
jgi:AraC family transcriptional regulator, arabinose operon regulatory protein